MPYGRKKTHAYSRRKAYSSGYPSKAKRGGRRKVYRKKLQRWTTASKSIIRQPSGVPDRLFVKLTYSCVISYSSVSGAVVYQQFRGNGAFDPDVTGVGGQPYLFDQWSALYNYYRIRGSSLKSELQIPPPASGSFAGCVTALQWPTNLANTPSATHELNREQPYTKLRNYKAYGDHNLPIKQYMSTSKILGLRKVVPSIDNTYTSAVGSNPNQQWYWNYILYTSDLATTSFTIPVTHRLVYYIEFYDRARPALS